MIGQTISHYRIVEKLGEGGMGVVYKAEDLRLGRTVALKFLAPHLVSDPEGRQRFLREARAAAALDHPNICTVHEIDESEGRMFLAMAFVEGRGVKNKILERPLKLDEALDIATQTAQGLQAAHAKGVVHRDIKPANLMINPQGQVKIMDFGLAHLSDRTKVTETGTRLGTPAYMSPEQARGEEVDQRSDTWSLGVVLYEMVSGQLPFKGEREAAMLHSILNEEPEPLTALRSGIPVELDRIVHKALAKDPADRYQHVEDLAVDIRAVRNTTSTKTAASSGAAKATAKKVSRYGIAALAVLLLAVAGAYWASRRGPWNSGMTTDVPISSLAILPLRSLNQQTVDSHLGLGIADALITKLGQVGKMRVSPISAIRRYNTGETDALEAARQLKVDSVLDGSIQQSGDRIRVSVQLLRAFDGATLWAESFNTRSADLFDLQDDVAAKVMEKLAVELSADQRRRIEKRQTSSPEAFEYYSKAMYHLVNRGWTGERQESDLAIDLLREAIQRDPNYALAHAQLGYAYAWTALFMGHNPALIEQAKQELAIAERLDPELAEVHVARSLILWSEYERWKVDAAIRELRLAQGLNSSVGHDDLAVIYAHIGLEDSFRKHMELALAQDPNSETIRRRYVSELYHLMRPDAAAQMSKKLLNQSPESTYYFQKKMFGEAAKLVESNYRNDPRARAFPGAGLVGRGAAVGPPRSKFSNRQDRIILLIFQGQRDDALVELNSLAREIEVSERTRSSHHWANDLAKGYALLGLADEAHRWLRETVDEGFPCYPAFERDWMLDPVRKDPNISRLLDEVKQRWEAYRREFELAG
jgi:serine/threonine protein kinase/tetratricopeptide (TPR) repeat protein